MMRQLLKSLKYRINVYQGISPSLLATMSLSVNIKGNNHIELIENMVKNGMIQNQDEIKAFKAVDRQHFTKIKNPYENKPYAISKKENMTDIFTHSIIISNLSQHWKNNVTLLDVGTGHGYLSFLIAKILDNKGFNDYSISGIDIHAQSISFCQDLQGKLGNDVQRQTFKCIDLNEHLQSVKDDSLDVIIGGYYFEEDLSERLKKKLTQNGVGIWPTRSQSGQALYKFSKNKEKVYLIETLFSMPVVRTEVSKYFVGEGEEGQESLAQEQPKVLEKQDLTVDEIKTIKKKMQENLREQLKILMVRHRKPDGKLPNLRQMREIPEIKAKLIELENLPKLKVKCELK